jgi:hypothetical protein
MRAERDKLFFGAVLSPKNNWTQDSLLMLGNAQQRYLMLRAQQPLLSDGLNWPCLFVT